MARPGDDRSRISLCASVRSRPISTAVTLFYLRRVRLGMPSALRRLYRVRPCRWPIPVVIWSTAASAAWCRCALYTRWVCVSSSRWTSTAMPTSSRRYQLEADHAAGEPIITVRCSDSLALTRMQYIRFVREAGLWPKWSAAGGNCPSLDGPRSGRGWMNSSDAERIWMAQFFDLSGRRVIAAWGNPT